MTPGTYSRPAEPMPFTRPNLAPLALTHSAPLGPSTTWGMRSFSAAEAFLVNRSGVSQIRSTCPSAEMTSYFIGSFLRSSAAGLECAGNGLRRHGLDRSADGGLLLLYGRAHGPEDQLPRQPQRLQRGAADAKPRQRLLRGGLSPVDQGAGISPEPRGAEQPDHHGLPARAGGARRERRQGRADQHPDLLLRQRDLGWRDAHRAAGRRSPGRPLVRQRHDDRLSRRGDPRTDHATEEIAERGPSGPHRPYERTRSG